MNEQQFYVYDVDFSHIMHAQCICLLYACVRACVCAPCEHAPIDVTTCRVLLAAAQRIHMIIFIRIVHVFPIRVAVAAADAATAAAAARKFVDAWRHSRRRSAHV